MSDEKLSPRAALEALGFTFRPTTPGRIDVVIPGAVVWWDAEATWPDSEEAHRYVLQLGDETATEAARSRRIADACESQAREAEAQAAKTRGVVVRMR